MDDFYDPEDIEGANNIEVSDIGDVADDDDENLEHLLKYGIERDELNEFRANLCMNKTFLKKLPLFTARSAAPQTRILGIFVGSVLGFGSGNCNEGMAGI